MARTIAARVTSPNNASGSGGLTPRYPDRRGRARRVVDPPSAREPLSYREGEFPGGRRAGGVCGSGAAGGSAAGGGSQGGVWGSGGL